jgi:hypothetical protein
LAFPVARPRRIVRLPRLVPTTPRLGRGREEPAGARAKVPL